MSELIGGDAAEVMAGIIPGSVDLIFTDPPYPRKLAVPCFEILAQWAPHVLADGGSLVTIVPHYLLEETMQIMSGALKFRWIYSMDQEAGPHPRMAMGVEVCWKPMLHYVKRAYPSGRGFLRDKVNIPGPEKGLHAWQQAEAWCEYYIEKLTKPHDTVLDPFCGSGTVLSVAHRLGRHAIGIDNDNVALETAWRRLHEDRD